MNNSKFFLYPLDFEYYETGLCSRVERVIPLFHQYCIYHYPEHLNTEKFSWHLELLILYFQEINGNIDTIFLDRKTNVLALIEVQPCVLKYLEWSQLTGIMQHMQSYYHHEMNNFNTMSWFLWNNQKLWFMFPFLNELFNHLSIFYGMYIDSMKNFIKYRDVIYESWKEENKSEELILMI